VANKNKQHSGVPGHDPRFTHDPSQGGSVYDKNTRSNPNIVNAPTLPDDWDDEDTSTEAQSEYSTEASDYSEPTVGAEGTGEEKNEETPVTEFDTSDAGNDTASEGSMATRGARAVAAPSRGRRKAGAAKAVKKVAKRGRANTVATPAGKRVAKKSSVLKKAAATRAKKAVKKTVKRARKG
jgi:hypothetical protein